MFSAIDNSVYAKMSNLRPKTSKSEQKWPNFKISPVMMLIFYLLVFWATFGGKKGVAITRPLMV